MLRNVNFIGIVLDFFKNREYIKYNLSFDPRLAVHINKDGLTPQMETLTTISVPITKKLSEYALFQTYDTTNLFKKGSCNNIGINGGIVYNF